MTTMPPRKTPKNHPLGKALDTSHVRLVTINDNEEVRVSEEAQETFYFGEQHELNDAAMKCPGCQQVTVHKMTNVCVFDVSDEKRNYEKRLALCSNCGKIGLK